MSVKKREFSIEQAIILDPPKISANATVAEAIALMSSRNKACKFYGIDSENSSQLTQTQSNCILVTEGKKLIGILTGRDLVKLCGQNRDQNKNNQSTEPSLSETTIAEVMVCPVHSLLEREFTDILVPIQQLHRYKIKHLPLVDNQGEVVGLLTAESLQTLLRPIDMLRLQRVSEVMITNVVHALPTDSIAAIANLMSAQNVRSVVIAEHQDRGLIPLGIITEDDLVQYLVSDLALNTTLAQIVINSPVAVSSDDTLWTVQELMQEQAIDHIIVAAPSGQIEGIISQSDLIRAIQPDIYKLISPLKTRISKLEQEHLERSQSQNKLLERQVPESPSALLESNDMFRQFAEHNHDVIVIREVSSQKLLYVSPAYEKIWGQTSESLYQDPCSWIQSIHPEDRERIRQSYAAKVNTGYFSEEYRIVRPDGAIHWVWGRCFPIKNTNGEIYRIAAIIEDISDRKQTERELQLQQEFLITVVNSAPSLLFVKNYEGKYLIANQALADLYGTTVEELVGKTDRDIQPNLEIAEQFHAQDCDVIEKNQSLFITEEKSTFPNRENEWFQWQKTPIVLPKNSTPAVLGIGVNITKRKEIEIALRESESKQRALINALPDLILRISGDGIFLDFISTDTFPIFGSEDLIGSNIYDDDLPIQLTDTRMQYIQEALRTGDIQIYDQEIEINGKLQIEEVRIAVCGENEVIVIVRDISDRKLAETALKQSEQRLKASESLLSGMFKRSVVGMAITDIDGRFIRTNPFYQQMVGYSESELELMRFTDNMLPEDIAENLRLRDLVLSDESESYQMEKRLLHRDGRVIWVRTTSSKIFDEVNRSPLFIGVIEDISDRKQAEVERQEAIDALYQLNQQLESRVEQRTRELKLANQQLIIEISERQKLIALVENSTDFIAIADHDGWLNYVNTAGRELVGILDNAKNLSIFDLHFPEDCPELKRNIIDLIARDETWEGEFRLRHCQTHEAIPVLFSAFPVQNSFFDETFSLAYIVRDISERKKAEEIVIKTNEALICTNTDLARATRLKDEFLANMSHELRTPLNAILGMSEGLMSGVFGDVNERQKRSLSLIESSGQHLLELINDILDVAKIGSGKLKLEVSPVAIEHLCKSSLNFVKQIANQKNIKLSLSVQNNLGAITVDERRIKQALINLLSNAVKFTPMKGKISLEVKLVRAEETSLTLTAEFPYVLSFSVIDNGIGIAPENLNKLFQTFVQIDSSLNRQYAGTGLGLTLVKQIAELHDGCVSVTSKVGEGSCFSMLLPYAGKVRSNNLDRISSLPTDSLSETIGVENSPETHEMLNPLILLAEDNQTNIETFADYLISKGYRLIFALDGQEAVNMAIAQVPDLILMDIQMPVLDGLGAIRQIRSNQNLSQIPIVALTALAMASDREKCLQAGANEYLSKPVKLSQLAATIQIQLQKAKIH